MTVEKLFKRYLKEIGVYATSYCNDSIMFLRTYSEPFVPFNSFRWDTTKEGFLYWFERALNWLIYLYNNADEVEDDKVNKECCATVLNMLLEVYADDESSKAVKLFACYNDITNIFKEQGISH